MILAFVQRYALAASLTLAAAGWAAAGVQTLRLSSLKLKNAEALAYEQTKARTIEQNWQQDAATADEVHDDEIARIHSEHLRDLERLRQRAAKRLPATPESCAGASPAALSSEDSSVVVGWGAEFDTLRADYAKCKAAVER